MSLQLQLFTASVLALTGVAVALFYDIYRAARRVFRWRGWCGELADLVFWVVSAGILVLGLIAGSWGAVRWYGLLMLGAGAAAYFLLAAPVLSPLWHRCWTVIRRPLRAAAAGLQRGLQALARRRGAGPRLPRLQRPAWLRWAWPRRTGT